MGRLVLNMSYQENKKYIYKWRASHREKWNKYMHLYNLTYKWKKICTNYTLIENYELAKADDFWGWLVHHKKEIELNKSMKELKDIGLYYNVPPEDLIFMRRGEHSILHAENRRKNKNGVQVSL